MAGGKGKCNSRDSRAFQPEPALFPLEAGMGNCASPSCVIVKLLILLVDSLRGFSPSDIRGCYSPRAVDCAFGLIAALLVFSYGIFKAIRTQLLHQLVVESKDQQSGSPLAHEEGPVILTRYL